MKELSFLYQKFNSEENKNLKLEIKQLRITGTEYSDFSCTPCSAGYSLAGSDRCSLCEKDFYLNPASVLTFIINLKFINRVNVYNVQRELIRKRDQLLLILTKFVS